MVIMISEECISSLYFGLEVDKEEFLKVQEFAEEDRDSPCEFRTNSELQLCS